MKDENENMKENLSKSEKSIYGSISGKFTMPEEETKNEKVKYTRTQWMTLITLAFGNFCAGACVSLQAPFFPAEAESKGATPTEYGFIFGVFQLTIFITAPLMGKIVPYISPKFLLNSGILTVGVTCILFGTLDLVLDTTSFVALAFVIRTVEGVGAAALRTSCYTIIASQFTEGLGTTFAVLETFLGVGLITGPTLGGALYDVGGYGLPFYVVGSFVIVDAIAIFFFLPDVENPKVPKKGNMLKFWLHPRTMIYSLGVFTSFNYIGFNQATLEPHLRRFDLSGFLLGMMFALSGTIYALTAPAWGRLCDKKCNPQVLSLLGCGISVVSLLLIGPAPFFNMAPAIWIVIVSLILMGLGLGAKLVCAFTGTLQDTMNRGLPPDLSTYGLVSSMIASSQSLGFLYGELNVPKQTYTIGLGKYSIYHFAYPDFYASGAFVGPSIGGFLLDEFGFRKASMTLLILETVLILLLIISICKKKSWIQKSEKTKQKMSKKSLSNGYTPTEEDKKSYIKTIDQ